LISKSFEFVIKILVSILTVTRSVSISLCRPSGAQLKSRVRGLCVDARLQQNDEAWEQETGAVVLRVTARCTVHIYSGRKRNILVPLMRGANTDIAPDKPVT
jgi:hypothetical protein